MAEERSDGKDFERRLSNELLRVRIGVRHVERVEVNFGLVRVQELLPAVVGKDPMADERRHLAGTVLQQGLRAFDQRTAGLNEIVDDDAVQILRIAYAEEESSPIERRAVVSTDLL